MSSEPQQKYSFESYLVTERLEEFRNEFVDGQVYAMTGATENHNLIVVNLAGELRAQLKKSPCRVFANDMKVRIDFADACTYPDISALCGERQFYDERRDIITNPALIVEVLSKSTEAYDRGDKFALYRQLTSLREYLLVSQGHFSLELYSRQGDGHWLLSTFDRPEQEVRLESVQCALSLTEVYDKVELYTARIQ